MKTLIKELRLYIAEKLIYWFYPEVYEVATGRKSDIKYRAAFVIVNLIFQIAGAFWLGRLLGTKIAILIFG